MSQTIDDATQFLVNRLFYSQTTGNFKTTYMNNVKKYTPQELTAVTKVVLEEIQALSWPENKSRLQNYVNSTYDFTTLPSLFVFLCYILMDQFHDLKPSREKKGSDKQNAVQFLLVRLYKSNDPDYNPFSPAYIDKQKTLRNINSIQFSVFVKDTINRYIAKSDWLSLKVRSELIKFNFEDNNEFVSIRNKLFLPIKHATADKINSSYDEHNFTKHLFELLTTMYPGEAPYRSIGGLPNSRTVTMNSYVSFNQSSKSSGIAAVARAQNSTKNKTLSKYVTSTGFKHVISLPILLDAGQSLASHPANTFYRSIAKLIGDRLEGKDTLEMYNNFNSTFMLTLYEDFNCNFTVNGHEAFVTKYKIENGELKFYIGSSDNQNRIQPTVILSASSLKNSSIKISDLINKSWGDISIFLVSLATNSTAVTGDTMAGTFYQLFSFFLVNGYITTNPPRNISFIFEETPVSVIVTLDYNRSKLINAELYEGVNVDGVYYAKKNLYYKNDPRNINNMIKRTAFPNISKIDYFRTPDIRKRVLRFKEILNENEIILKNFYKLFSLVNIVNNKNIKSSLQSELKTLISQISPDTIANVPMQQSDGNIVRYLLHKKIRIGGRNLNISNLLKIKSVNLDNLSEHTTNTELTNKSALTNQVDTIDKKLRDTISKIFKYKIYMLQFLNEEEKQNFIYELALQLKQASKNYSNKNRQNNEYILTIQNIINNYLNTAYQNFFRIVVNKKNITNSTFTAFTGLENSSLDFKNNIIAFVTQLEPNKKKKLYNVLYNFNKNTPIINVTTATNNAQLNSELIEKVSNYLNNKTKLSSLKANFPEDATVPILNLSATIPGEMSPSPYNLPNAPSLSQFDTYLSALRTKITNTYQIQPGNPAAIAAAQEFYNQKLAEIQSLPENQKIPYIQQLIQ